MHSDSLQRCLEQLREMEERSYVYTLTDDDCVAIYGSTQIPDNQRRITDQQLRDFINNNQATQAMIDSYNRNHSWGRNQNTTQSNVIPNNYRWGDRLNIQPVYHRNTRIMGDPPRTGPRPNGWRNNANQRNPRSWGAPLPPPQPHINIRGWGNVNWQGRFVYRPRQSDHEEQPTQDNN